VSRIKIAISKLIILIFYLSCRTSLVLRIRQFAFEVLNSQLEGAHEFFHLMTLLIKLGLILLVIYLGLTIDVLISISFDFCLIFVAIVELFCRVLVENVILLCRILFDIII